MDGRCPYVIDRKWNNEPHRIKPADQPERLSASGSRYCQHSSDYLHGRERISTVDKVHDGSSDLILRATVLCVRNHNGVQYQESSSQVLETQRLR